MHHENSGRINEDSLRIIGSIEIHKAMMVCMFLKVKLTTYNIVVSNNDYEGMLWHARLGQMTH